MGYFVHDIQRFIVICVCDWDQGGGRRKRLNSKKKKKVGSCFLRSLSFLLCVCASVCRYPIAYHPLNGMQTHRRRPSKSILLPRTLATAPHHHSTYARRMTIHLPESVPDNTHLWGYALLCATFFVFVATMYAMVGSKYAPKTNIEVNRKKTSRW